MKITAPCVIPDLPIEAYHNTAPGLSSSQMVDLIHSPGLYYGRYVTGEYEKPDSPAFAFGNALDWMLTSPSRFDELVAIKPVDFDGRKKEGKEWLAARANLVVISQQEKQVIDLLVKKLAAKKISKKIFGANEMQLSYFMNLNFEFAGEVKTILIKCRPDRLSKWFISDDKSDLDPSYNAFSKKIGTCNYHIKAAMYKLITDTVDGVERDFIFNVYGKKPPYMVKHYILKDCEIATGMEYFYRAIETLLVCQASGIWPDEVTDENWYHYKDEGEWYDFTDTADPIERTVWQQKGDM